MHVQVGDKVWWRIRAGMFYRTLSGTLMSIDKKTNIASVNVQTQNVHGALRNVHVNLLTKKS